MSIAPRAKGKDFDQRGINLVERLALSVIAHKRIDKLRWKRKRCTSLITSSTEGLRVKTVTE